MFVAPINSNEWHAWFHLYGVRRAVRKARQATNSNESICIKPGFKPANFRSEGERLDHSVASTDDKLCFDIFIIYMSRVVAMV